MKIEYKIIKNELSGNQRKLLEMIFRNLKIEFDYYLEYFTKDEKSVPIEELYEYNERAYIGFLNNAMVRGDISLNYYTLQEYCVKNNKTRKSGRADFLILDINNREYYLIEAKQRYTTENADIESEKKNPNGTREYLNEILGQAESYIHADREFFENKNLFSCALVFESVVLNSSSTPDEYIKKPDTTSIPGYFYACYYMQNINRVLNVYGLIKEFSF